MSSAGISRTGQGTKRAQAFCIAYISRRSNKDGWLGYPLSTSFQKWSKAVSKRQANEERHLQQMRATLINTIPRSYYTVPLRASKCATCYCIYIMYVHKHTYGLIYISQIITFPSFKMCFSNRLWVTKINLRLFINSLLLKINSLLNHQLLVFSFEIRQFIPHSIRVFLAKLLRICSLRFSGFSPIKVLKVYLYIL